MVGKRLYDTFIEVVLAQIAQFFPIETGLPHIVIDVWNPLLTNNLTEISLDGNIVKVCLGAGKSSSTTNVMLEFERLRILSFSSASWTSCPMEPFLASIG